MNPNNVITLQVFCDNRRARGFVAAAIRDLGVEVLSYVSRRNQMDQGVPRYEATPFYVVRVSTRYEGRQLKLAIDAHVASAMRGNRIGTHAGCLVSGIPHQSPDIRDAEAFRAVRDLTENFYAANGMSVLVK